MAKKICSVCKGTGMEEVQGWGKVFSKLCTRCNGSGKLEKNESKQK